jgi:Flp pilus assembly protein TadG
MNISSRHSQNVKRFLKRDTGTQLVELAIVLPVLMMLIAGAAEFGRFFYTYSALTNAVRAGARHASKWERNASWTFPETSNMVVYGDYSNTSISCKPGQSGPCPILPGLSTANVVVQANGPSVNSIDSVTVKIVNYRYTPIFDLGQLTGIKSLSMNVSLNASSTMHQLFNGPVAH